jgi:hypothetical protein
MARKTWRSKAGLLVAAVLFAVVAATAFGATRNAEPVAQTAGVVSSATPVHAKDRGPVVAHLGAARHFSSKPHRLVLTRAGSAVFDVRKLKSTVVKRERPEHPEPFGPPGREEDDDAAPQGKDADATGHDKDSNATSSGNAKDAGESTSALPPKVSARTIAAAATSAPAPDSSFAGLDFQNWGAGHPPDPNGDVGPNDYIQVVNTSIGIYDKPTGNRVAAFTFNAFMSQGHFGNLCDTDNFGDPVVLYDSFDDRWFITDFAFKLDASGNVNPQTVYQCFAVSKTGDPVNGGWNFYSILDPGGLGDYPKFGVWPDGIYMSANMFGYGSGASYTGFHVWALNKEQMYAGAPQVSVVDFAGNSSDFTVIPSNARLQSGTPPAGSPEYFVSTEQFLNGLSIYKLHVDWDKVSTSTFTGPQTALAPNCWPNATPANASTTANAADVLAIRAMAEAQYSNIGGAESLWVSHTVQRNVSANNTTCNATTGGNASIRWYQANVTGGTVGGNLVQGSTYDPEGVNTFFRYMPALAVDRVGDMAIDYMKSNSTTNPQIKYAGRLASDPPNTLAQGEQTLIDGTGSQSGNCGGAACVRWGDYSGMALDPNGCEFWMTEEYYATSGLNYQTRIGSFHFPGCTTVGNGTLSGTVTDGTNPVAGATVSLGSRTTTTDSNGAYSFTVPAGTYPTETAAQSGFDQSSASSLVVPDSGTLTQNFTLAAAAQSGCFTDNSQSTFQRGVPTNCDLTSSPGTVALASPDNTAAQNSTVSPTGFAISNTVWGGQTFTPTVSGQLKRVDVELFCSGCSANSPNITLSIRATTGTPAVPTGADLANATLPGFNDGAAGGLKTFTFSSPITVTAGTTYAFIFRNATTFAGGTVAYTCSCATTGFVNSNPYANGQRVSSSTSGSTWAADTTAGGRDLNFVTYINPGFASTGIYVSSIKDANPAAGSAANWKTLSFAASTPTGTAVKFQVAASNNVNGPFNYVGPDGTAATFFSTSGVDLSQFDGFRYLRYEAFLTTSNPSVTPSLSSVAVCYEDVSTVTATTLAADSASGTFGGTTTLSATLTGAGNGVSGESVTFSLNGTSVGGTTTDANGVATLDDVSLAGIDAGSYPNGVTATFAGDSTHGSSTDSSSLTVAKADQAITITKHAPATATFGTSFDVDATGGGSGNAIDFSSSGACSNTGATFTMTGSGACDVMYDQAGNGNYNAAPELTETVNSEKADQTITVTQHAPATAAFGTGFTVDANGGGSGNPVTFGSSGACSNNGADFTMTSGTGTCTVLYDQAGDDNHNAAQEVIETVTAQKADQTIVVTTHAPDTATYNTGFTVDANAPGEPVAFSSDGACTNTGPDFTMTSGMGDCTVHYDAAGDSNYNAATQVTETVTAQKADQSITFAALSDHTYGDTDFDPGATASSGFAVSYGATGACSIVGGVVHLTGAGSCTVTASQAGDDDYAAATDVPRTFSIGKAALLITAHDRSKVYSQALDLGTTAFSASGLVGSDSVSGVTLTSSGAAADATAGTYPIAASLAVAGSGTDLGNYAVDYGSGTLTVVSPPLVALTSLSVNETGGAIDTFDSSLGAYGDSNHGGGGLVIGNGKVTIVGVMLSGDVRSTQSSVVVKRSAAVSGDVTAGTTTAIGPNAVSGTVTANSPFAAIAPPTVAACSPFSTSTGASGGHVSYTPKNGNLKVLSGTVTLASGTYCFHNVALSAGTVLQVNGAVKLHLTGTFVGPKAQVDNTSNVPGNLDVETSYVGTTGVNIVGGDGTYMAIAAPGSGVHIVGGSYFGTVLGKTVVLKGNLAFHEDLH